MDETLNDTYQQVLLLKDITRKTGCLHDTQILQMKIWPLVLTHATKTAFSFNSNKKIVIYNLREFKGKKPKDFNKRLSLLRKYTKDLLGEEYQVKIKCFTKEKPNGQSRKQKP